ncbi:MAG TPA: hypothetical protein VGF99_09065 [Myxococcota bacterium]
MVDWKRLLDEDARDRKGGEEDDDWRQEAADSLCELYYETYRTQKGRGSKRLDLRPGSDYRRFLDSHMKPLGRYGIWEALFPNRVSATSAQAIDEALHLLADTKLVDRVYSGDIVTVTKIVTNIQKKRGKYLELDGRGGEDVDGDELAIEDENAPDDELAELELEEE